MNDSGNPFGVHSRSIHNQNHLKKMEKIIQDISTNAANTLLKVSKFGVKTIKEFSIDCSELDDFNQIDIRNSSKFKEMFSELKELYGPCLYYFEITSNITKEEIVDRVKAYSITVNAKTTPAIKSKIQDSNVLYVGKVKRLFWGRLIQHLGYFKQPRTQGLQLYYWAKEIDLKLKLVVFEFEPEMIELMEVLENDLAKRIKPILGKHK